MSSMYGASHRALQDRFDTRRLADRLEQVKVHSELTDEDVAFIAARDILFLATCDERGQPTCSFKAGEPGFIRVLDRTTLTFPWYDGNGMYLSAGNVAATARLGLLLIDFVGQRRLRIDGDGELLHDAELLANYPDAQFVVKVAIKTIYPNCPRYIPKYQLIERSPFIPRAGETPPVPEWKQSDWARDVLPRTVRPPKAIGDSGDSGD
jgi:predicted pyridoxine 5'-phosphate oxidase superfamily flavin-nucleotide-binding protein